MKKSLGIILLLIVTNSQAQNATLFAKSNNFGGFGGVSMDVFGKRPPVIQGEGAMLFRNLYIGGYGYSAEAGTIILTNQKQPYNLNTSLGGLMLGYISNRHQGLSIFGDLKIGWGEMIARRNLSEHVVEEYTSPIQVITPKFGLAYTYRFMQLRAFGGYQFSSEIQINEIKPSQLTGAYFGFGLFIGSFLE